MQLRQSYKMIRIVWSKSEFAQLQAQVETLTTMIQLSQKPQADILSTLELKTLYYEIL